jgi:hypothetical protein|nr:MAG TPA: hypothetical protein [Bacteriophage sp.]DAL67105.1 MAG TPA: hypothetical protein [Bacteriophage sp.]DAR34620.1 MAG TPA: hypothetical protein [Caudoviricetes sp.]
MERDIDKRQTVEEAAHFFAESRSSGSAFPAYYQGFIAGAEWEMAEAINAHWKSCPNLSKDNDRMCNQMNDCNQNCEYMRSFIRLLRGIVLTEPSREGS